MADSIPVYLLNGGFNSSLSPETEQLKRNPRWRPQRKSELKKLRWITEEDQKLRESKSRNDQLSSKDIAWREGLNKTSKKCRERWKNHPSQPSLRGGNGWGTIASKLQRRTANAVKSRWNNHLNKSTHQNIPLTQSCTGNEPDATQVANIHFQQYSNTPNA